MSRQYQNQRSERKQEGQRKEQARNAGPSYGNVQGQSRNEMRNRADNTRLSGMDPSRLNDLYERSSM